MKHVLLAAINVYLYRLVSYVTLFMVRNNQ
jgi:hypothetical protein